jgi:hypothetical protein
MYLKHEFLFIFVTGGCIMIERQFFATLAGGKYFAISIREKNKRHIKSKGSLIKMYLRVDKDSSMIAFWTEI